MLKEYMQRSATAGTAVSAQDYSQIEEKSHAACERLPCLVARQQAREQPAHADSSIAQAVQVVPHNADFAVVGENSYAYTTQCCALASPAHQGLMDQFENA